MKPYLIAIAGFSGAGKTTIARRLADELAATIFSLDAYYRDLPHLTYKERCLQNFDHPESMEEELIAAHLGDLAAGREIVRPIYDFSTHSRTQHTELMRPNQYIIVEGLFTLHWDSVRPLYGTKVFVEAPHKLCLARREARDTAERGRTRESVHQQYAQTVAPMADQFIAPTKQFADIVLNESQSLDEWVETVLEDARGKQSASGGQRSVSRS